MWTGCDDADCVAQGLPFIGFHVHLAHNCTQYVGNDCLLFYCEVGGDRNTRQVQGKLSSYAVTLRKPCRAFILCMPRNYFACLNSCRVGSTVAIMYALDLLDASFSEIPGGGSFIAHCCRSNHHWLSANPAWYSVAQYCTGMVTQSSKVVRSREWKVAPSAWAR